MKIAKPAIGTERWALQRDGAWFDPTRSLDAWLTEPDLAAAATTSPLPLARSC